MHTLNFSQRKIVIFFFILAASGCNIKRPCDEATSFPVKAGFYQSYGQELTDTLLSGVTVFALENQDSLLYEMDTLMQVELPLSPFSDSTNFVIQYKGIADTILFTYNRRLTLLSEACGFVMFFSINNLQPSHHLIDSLILTDKNLDADQKEHLKIILH